MQYHQFTKESGERNKETMQFKNTQKTINEMAVISSYLSKINPNVNGLNTIIKRHRVAEWTFFFLRPTYMLPTRDSVQL